MDVIFMIATLESFKQDAYIYGPSPDLDEVLSLIRSCEILVCKTVQRNPQIVFSLLCTKDGTWANFPMKS